MTHKRIDARFYNDLGRTIRLARETAGKTQSDVAAHLDVTCQQFQKYENGTNRIPVNRLISLSEYLDAPLLRFFAFMDLSANDNDELHRLMQSLTGKQFRLLLHSWNKMKDGGRTIILNLAKHLADL